MITPELIGFQGMIPLNPFVLGSHVVIIFGFATDLNLHVTGLGDTEFFRLQDKVHTLCCKSVRSSAFL